MPLRPYGFFNGEKWLNDNNLPLKLHSGVLHREQLGLERLHDGFAS